MRIIFSKNAWEDYISWQTEDKKTLNKINTLIKDIQRVPYEGIGKPEPLKFDLAGFWSRRIDLEHRLVYQVDNSDILIYACHTFCPAKAGFRLLLFADPQLLLLHPRQIRNGCCTRPSRSLSRKAGLRVRSSARN